MVSKGSEQHVLWPRYFDARLSRAEGRRVPKAMAVRDPDVKWIASAAVKAGMDADIQPDVTDPRVPYRQVGRVLVPKKGAKEATIKAVAAKMASE